MKHYYKKFRKFAEKVGSIQAKIVLSAVFFLIIIPLSVVIKVTLKKRMLFYSDRSLDTYWSRKEDIEHSLPWARKQ